MHVTGQVMINDDEYVAQLVMEAAAKGEIAQPQCGSVCIVALNK